MFTGLIQQTAQVQTRMDAEGGLIFQIQKPASFKDLKLGESIAVDGICLTLAEVDSTTMTFFAGLETLGKTQIQLWKPGRMVNLERSLRMSDRLGGHIVSGHIHGTGLLTAAEPRGPCLWLEIVTKENLINWMVPKGSVAINGVSLTINNLDEVHGKFEVLLIPETLSRTNLSHVEVGQLVNIECDQTVKIITEQLKRIGKYNEQHP